ncbi:MAG: putative tRNA pseudouridine synthase, partial [uncultured bacterium]
VDSPTYDMEGPLKLIDTYPSMAEVTAKIPDFVGNIEQAVPYYSAVKVAGKKLYNMARGGKEMPVDLPVKKVTIYGIEILDFSEKTVPFTDLGEQKLPVLTCLVNCSSGTYIRSLAHDLGGVLFNLRRTRVGDYIVQDSEDFLKMQPTN